VVSRAAADIARNSTRAGCCSGGAWNDLGLVIDQATDSPFRRTVSRGRSTGSLHDLRHGYATALLVGGVRPKVVSEAVGHSSATFAPDAYDHVLPSMQEQAATAIEAALGAAIRGES
jgi:integrase